MTAFNVSTVYYRQYTTGTLAIHSTVVYSSGNAVGKMKSADRRLFGDFKFFLNSTNEVLRNDTGPGRGGMFVDE